MFKTTYYTLFFLPAFGKVEIKKANTICLLTAKPSLLFILLFFSPFLSYSQNDILQTKIDKWLCCDLDHSLQDISEEYKIKFVYDREKLKAIRYTEHPEGVALEKVLKGMCKPNKLKFFVNDEGLVYVVEKWFQEGMETLDEEKNYTAASVKKNIKMTGRVVDKFSLESLPFVTVSVKGASTGTITNVDGNFTLKDIPTDTSTIVFTYIGYHKKEIYLNPKSMLNDVMISMEQETMILDEVNVTAEIQDVLQVSKQQAGIFKMSPIKLQTLPNLGEKDILRSFQLMPGISAANENSSGLYVRGGTPDQVLVLYDGFTVYNVEHMFGFFSAFNSNAIKDVQLFKGGFDAKYGGRLASVVEITGKDGNQKGFNLAADLSMMSINGFVEIPISDKLTSTFSARRSWESPIYNKIFSQYTPVGEAEPQGGFKLNDGTQQTSSYFYDVNAKVTYKPNDDDRLAFSFYNGQDKLDNSLSPMGGMRGGGNFSSENVDETKWGNTGASIKYSNQINEHLFMNSLVSYSNYFSNRTRTNSGTFITADSTEESFTRGMVEDNNLIDYTAKVDLEYDLDLKNKLEFGAQLIHNDIDYSFVNNDTLTVIDRNTTGQTYTAYVQDQIKLFDGKWIITPGIRYNFFTGTNKSYWEPRLITVYNLTDRWRIKASYGDYYQFAKRVTREDISNGSKDFWALADGNQLPVSSSRQYILGAAYETQNYLFDIEAFYKDMNNITEYSLRIKPSREEIDYSENFFSGYGMARGVDFLAQKKYGNFTGWIAYTWSQVINHIDAFGDYDYYASHDVTHELKLVGTYKWKNWDFGATWIYATGKPYTAPEGGYELSLLDGTTSDYINVTIKNGQRLPDYHRLDLSANYNFKIGGSAPATIGFSVFNVYNRSNVWYNQYTILDNEIIETPVYYLNITPNINLTIKLK